MMSEEEYDRVCNLVKWILVHASGKDLHELADELNVDVDWLEVFIDEEEN